MSSHEVQAAAYNNGDNASDSSNGHSMHDSNRPSFPSFPPPEPPAMPPPPLPPTDAVAPPDTPTAVGVGVASPSPTIVAIPPKSKSKSRAKSDPVEVETNPNVNTNVNTNTSNNVTTTNNDTATLISPSSSTPNPSSVEEAAALLGACITRLSNQSVYRTNTPPHGMHSAFSTVKPVPCSELYHRLASLHSLLQQAANDHNHTGDFGGHAAAPSIIPLLHKLLHISSTLALTPIYLHSSNSTVPQQPLPQQIIQSTIHNATTGTVNAAGALPINVNVNSSRSTSVSSTNTISSSNSENDKDYNNTSTNASSANANNNNNNKNNNISRNISHNSNTSSSLSSSSVQNLKVPPIRVTPPLSSKPIRHLWVKCITLAHRLSPPPPSSPAAAAANSRSASDTTSSRTKPSSNLTTSNNSFTPSTPTNILAPYLNYAISHPRSAKSSGGTRVSCFSVLEHIFQDDILSKRFFNIHHSKQYNAASNIVIDHNQLLLSELVTTCFNGLKSSGSNDVYHRIHAMKCIMAVFTAYRNNVLLERLLQNNNGGDNTHDDVIHNRKNVSSLQWNDMEERTIQEAIRMMKRAADDKYSEVRDIAAQFTSVLSTMLIHEKYQYAHLGSGSGGNSGSSSGGGSMSGSMGGFNCLDDVCLLCYRNIDDESVQVGARWSIALSRCMTTAIEYHTYISSSSSSSINPSSSTDGIDSTASGSNVNATTSSSSASGSATSSFHQLTSSMASTSNDLASKFKAYNETRRTLNSIASNSCLTIAHAFQFLVSQFIRVGHNAVSTVSGGGSSHGSSGGSGIGTEGSRSYVIDSSRAIRSGIGSTLVHFCEIQCSIGGIHTGAEKNNNGDGSNSGDNNSGVNNGSSGSSVNAIDPSQLIMDIILNMVGPAFEHQILTSESKISSSSGSGDGSHGGKIHSSNKSRDSSKRKIVEKSASAVGSFFGGGGGGSNSGSSNSVSGSQSKKLVCSSSVAGLARLIVGRVVRRGLSEMMTETMQLSLLRDFSSMASSSTRRWNRHQYQIAFVEISHLVSTLGEACASALDELIPSLQRCLSHSDHGVRYEAAVAFQAVTVAFPSAGRKCIMSMVDEIQVHHDEILAIANNRGTLSVSSDIVTDTSSSRTPSPKVKRRFGRKQDKVASPTTPISASTIKANAAIEKSMEHQYALHGNALVLSMVLHVMPKLPGGLPSELLDIIIAVADNLISCQGNGVLSQSQPDAIVTCVRAGYCIVSGALTMGVKSTLMHLQKIFGIWSKSATFIDGDLKRMGPSHDVSCLEPFVNSIVVFLRVSSELLLSVPDALNRTTQILEKVLPVIMGYSQLETDGNSPTISGLESAKAAIMESFSWLPPGSFPLVADSVFSFASHQIKVGTENKMSCGLLAYLVNREDDIIDVRCPTRTSSLRQTGGNITIDDSLMTSTSEYINHSQREAVLHFIEIRNNIIERNRNSVTPIGDLIAKNEDSDEPPTPLHEVGTWKEPPSTSKSTKARLMNAAIHVFAATFGLQGSHQQTTAIDMMEELVLSGGSDKSGLVTSTNIVATLLSCLRALPTHEGPGGGTMGTGPPWMTRSARLFLNQLQNPHSLVRRGAAEGLGLLVSVGVKCEVHTLQSSVMHSLEDMIQTSGGENTLQQKNTFDLSLQKKAGYLLSFGCIQRATSKLFSRNTRNRSLSSCSHDDTVSNISELSIPTMTMLTRLLPYTAIHTTDEDSFLTRTYALRSFCMILSYSKLIADKEKNLEERRQILSKAIEVVENNLFGAWKSNATEIDVRSQEMEKFAYEPAFLSSLIRLMSYIVPHLHLLIDGPSVVRRFSSMITVIIEISGYHSSVVLEGMSFYELLNICVNSLSGCHLELMGTRDIFSMVTPLINKIISPHKCQKLFHAENAHNSCSSSLECRIAATVFVEKFACAADTEILERIHAEKYKCSLISLFEFICGSRQYSKSRFPVSFSIGDRTPLDTQILELKVCESIKSLLHLDIRSVVNGESELLNWLLFSMVLVGGDLGYDASADSNATGRNSWRINVSKAIKRAKNDAYRVTSYSGNTIRWQMKHLAIKIACISLTSIASAMKDQSGNITNFNLAILRKNITNQRKSESHVLLHLKELLNVACGISTVTLDQCELFALQNAGLDLLSLLIEYFAETVDPNDPSPEAKEEVVQNFVSQIIPSVNHALGACDVDTDEEPVATEGARELFINGCSSLCLFVKKGLVCESTSLRRIMRPLMPAKDEFSLCSYPSSINDIQLHLKPRSFVDNRMSVLLPRIGKVSCLAKLCTFGAIGLIGADSFDTVCRELKGSEKELAVISAALAIDSFKLKVLDDSESKSEFEMISGLTFPNILDVSIDARNEMTDNWAAFAGFASILISNILKEEDESTEKMTKWMEKLLDIVFAGFYDSLELLDTITDTSSIKKAEQTCSICLMVLNNTLSFRGVDGTLVRNDMVNDILYNVLEKILYTWIDTSYSNNDNSIKKNMHDEQKSETDSNNNYSPKRDDINSSTLMVQACNFVEVIVGKTTETDSSVFRSLLKPLFFIQEDNLSFDFDDSVKMQIISSYVRSLTHLVKKRGEFFSDDIIRSLFDVCVRCFKMDKDYIKNEAVIDLVRSCLGTEVLSLAETSFYAKNAARDGRWSIWELLCLSSSDIRLLLHSSENICKAVEDVDNHQQHLSVLSATCNILRVHNDWIPDTLAIIGKQLLILFNVYGTNPRENVLTKKDRMLACSSCMKIIMLSFQFMISQANAMSPENKPQFEAELAEYLSVIFETLVSVIKFNGLPNQPQHDLQNPGSADSVLGRMCAQFFVHVLRTCPSSFKLCVGTLSDTSRSILESSVRADMSGYASRAVAPSKKKLNIKTFVSSSRQKS